ncbi:hypothetical protein Y032_0042g543 [Ancylostoma ceylanicum]|uniref:Uncharacterized protein n=1 Tax=Ancylostoma ceylanicum TaxID=53326 RepID=A0A016UF64_9BILA|nr:hypothetical protein Y032_0042g543 [Ancylostoma ceylanicum]
MFVVLRYGEECVDHMTEYGSLKASHTMLDETCSLFEDLDKNLVAACFCRNELCNNPYRMSPYIEHARSNYETLSENVGYWKPYTTKNRDKDIKYISCLRQFPVSFEVLDVEPVRTFGTDLDTSIFISALLIFLLSAISIAFCGAIAGKSRSKNK